MAIITIPSPGFGTFRLKGTEVKQATEHALEVGFRHIDTAQIYDNEADIGDVLSQSNVDREDIFLTTKVWFDNFTKDKFIDSVDQSLEKLQTDYVDLLLIHWPSPDHQVPMSEYLPELVSCMHKSKTRSIGVSNFTPQLIEEAAEVIGKENILVNQVEVHPLFQNRHTVDYCNKQGIQIVSYMPLGNGEVVKNSLMSKIAKKYNVSPATIAIAWQLQQGLIPIPASTSKAHLAENFSARNIRLEKEDMDAINELDTNQRMIDPDFAPDW
ncbi:2,5-didehydrogluconate reductase DkgB [Aestuariibacter sp. AA17]|uniref:2,5-didehydrogluconate reductase DkgB n=1 Tax=Fluctibacter corallii TaxID=2984329 RepID=A0ABT3ADJ6_9ALTE|nr:2,5-didehydrogluconate reductase DkgB [Aestuariibacter sp. AA17]MCV2886387.1 2,5-didehydrogluconate reductase DkgB [Aestuariibacter sp. AA17]